MDFRKKIIQFFTYGHEESYEESYEESHEESHNEYEIRYKKIEYSDFIDVCSYLDSICSDVNTEVTMDLSPDVNIDSDHRRYTISGVDKIYKYCTSSTITFDEIIDKQTIKFELIDAYNIKLSISTEAPILEKDEIKFDGNLLVRYKNRKTYRFNNFKCDATAVKQHKSGADIDMKSLFEQKETYEIEVEWNRKHLIYDEYNSDMFMVIENIYKILNKTHIIYEKSIEENIINKISKKLYSQYNLSSTQKQIPKRRLFPCPNIIPVSKDNINSLTDNIYITPKVDGFHGILVIFIDNTGEKMLSEKMLCVLDQKFRLNILNTILMNYEILHIFECEIVYSNYKLHSDIYLIDCLVYNSNDIRNETFNIRYGNINEFSNDFINDYLNVSILTKEFKLIKPGYENIRSEIMNMNSKTYDFDTDGIILINSNNKYILINPSEKLDTFKDIFKYKPISKQSIDLRVRYNKSDCLPFEEIYVQLYMSDESKEIKYLGIKLKCNKYGKLVIPKSNNIIKNRDIVEFINIGTTWTPIKIRYEKDFPNGKNVVENITKSRDIFEIVYYKKEISTDSKKVLIKPLTDFHNHIKMHLLDKYCKKRNNIYVADLACGVGGDFFKYSSIQNIIKVLGLDIDPSNLQIARERADQAKKKRGDRGDRGVKSDKSKSIQIELKQYDLSKFNNTITSEKFDIITCNFAIHYLFNEKTSLLNFIRLVKFIGKPGCHIIITTNNGEEVDNIFGMHKNKIFYKSINNQMHQICEYVKKYDTYLSDCGNTIGARLPHINEDMIDEWLVDKTFIINTFKENNIILIESIQFSDLYNVILAESKKYKNPMTPMDGDEKSWSFLNIAYIFKLDSQ